MHTNDARGFAADQNVDLLKRVLALEERKGFRDSAATGGLERFAANIASRASRDGSPPNRTVTAVAGLFRGYAGLSPAERRKRVDDAMRALSGAHPTQPSPPTRSAPGGANRTPRQTPTARPATRKRTAVRFTSLDDPVPLIPGVGEGRARQLDAIGARTIRDLIYLFPRRHKDYARVQPIGSPLFHAECTVRGRVTSVQEDRTVSGKHLVTVEIDDGTGRIKALWFNPYIARQIKVGNDLALSGRVEQQRGMRCFKSPEWELLDDEMLHTGRIVPVYPLTKNLYQKNVRQIVRIALDGGLPLVSEPLAEEIRARHELVSLQQALEWIHFPESDETLQRAAQRLAFDEFLVLQLGLVRRKVEWQREAGHAIDVSTPRLEQFHQSLAFELTGAQRRALDEILGDMTRARPMSRLLQGDVGSGKTVVAASAALVAIADGFQAAILAPTEILAEQHFSSLSRMLSGLDETIRPAVALLTGSTPAARRAEIDAGLRSGEIDLLVGTHAILEERVEFARLGLAIVDEQHRFGVGQRAALRGKGFNPDVLVMTATPIPRSLALVMHGDLDVSIIDEMPPGRQAIETHRVEGSQRRRVHQFMRKQIERGHQVFVIYPLVEESEAIDARAATVEHERLATEIFPDLRVGLLHGRMKPREKDAVMTAFRDREIDILVSTSVVEVGIDVPNATLMVIEGAERFGLSQLHQFRGRVGRGAARSYCILVSEDPGDDSARRLDALVETQDGFRLAEIDLDLRGPGEFFGTRQSGLPDLQLASLGDLTTLQRARDEAHRILEADPNLEQPENRLLREHVDRFWSGGAGDLS
jgi:ATP-dependent DNA helicase RecG